MPAAHSISVSLPSKAGSKTDLPYRILNVAGEDDRHAQNFCQSAKQGGFEDGPALQKSSNTISLTELYTEDFINQQKNAPCFLARGVKNVHPPLNRSRKTLPIAGSGRAFPQHTEGSSYRCYLPVLAGFKVFCCTGPSRQRHLSFTN